MVRTRKKLTEREKNLKKEIIRQVKNAPEPKHHYSSQSLFSVDFGGNIYNLLDMAQGVTSQQRIGDRAALTHLSLRGRVTNNNSTGTINTIRVIVFIWKVDTAERTPAANDIIQNTYLSASYAPYGPLVVGQERNDIDIISDRTYDLSYNSDTQHSFHLNKRMDRKLYFNAGATTGKNQPHVMFISDDGVTLYPQAEFVCQATIKEL